jgi:predicted MFS family arabinose efflux permease
VFVAATVWCSLARTIEGFIAARALCGLGAGGSMTLGAIIVSDLVPIEYVLLNSTLAEIVTSRDTSHANFLDPDDVALTRLT